MVRDRKAYQREYRQRPEVIAIAKKRRNYPEARAKRRARQQRYELRYKDKRSRRARAKIAQLRLEALVAYSGSQPHCMCECGCAVNNLAFLDIDHANNDGARHRRELGRGGGRFYMAMKKQGWPKDLGLRVLCCNCNTGRARNGGQCPLLEILPIEERAIRKQGLHNQPERTLFDNLKDRTTD